MEQGNILKQLKSMEFALYIGLAFVKISFRKYLRKENFLMNNKNLGEQGEDKACEYLKRNGYKILFRNYRALKKEIDIIALKNNTLVFVEVKTRVSDKYGDAADSVNYFKQKNIILVAKYFILKSDKEYDEYRFDVIEMYPKRIMNFFWKINHIKAAFTL